MNDNLITWNVRNWITVVLMLMLGWLVIMTAVYFMGGKRSSVSSETGYVPVGA